MRHEYKVNLVVNGRKISKAIIDPHYEEKHAGSIHDKLILELLELLNHQEFRPQDVDEEGFEYYVIDRMYYKGKQYRFIWLLHPEENYIGIINVFRRK